MSCLKAEHVPKNQIHYMHGAQLYAWNSKLIISTPQTPSWTLHIAQTPWAGVFRSECHPLRLTQMYQVCTLSTFSMSDHASKLKTPEKNTHGAPDLILRRAETGVACSTGPFPNRILCLKALLRARSLFQGLAGIPGQRNVLCLSAPSLRSQVCPVREYGPFGEQELVLEGYQNIGETDL